MEFLDVLIKEALKSNMIKKISAALVYRGKIISLGHNYHTILYNNFNVFHSSIHAEQACINRCKNKKLISKSKMIIIRINNKKNLIPCEPCHTCLSIIKKYKIKTCEIFKN